MSKRLPSTLPNMVMALVVTALLAGAALGGMYEITKDPIARQAANAQLAAIRAVAPPFDNDPEKDKYEQTADGIECTVYPARKDGKRVGAAVKAVTMDGFAGKVEVMVGLDADGTVRDYRVLQQGETPGLGSRMETWFRDPTAARSILGKNPATTDFHVSKDGGQIDGITAATISSRAFLGAVRAAYQAGADKQSK